MYQLDILTKNHKWEYFCESNDIQEIDKVVYKLTNLRPNKFMRVLENNLLLCFLDGTEYQYWYWKNKYVRERKNIDIVASYYEHKKKLEKTKEK